MTPGEDLAGESGFKKAVTARLQEYNRNHNRRTSKLDTFNNIRGNRSLVPERTQENELKEEEEQFRCRINPEGTFKKFWETSKFVLLIFVLLYLPVKVAFIHDKGTILNVLEKFIDFIFFLDIILSFFTPVYVGVEMVFSLKEIAKAYLKGWFLADLLSIIPFEEIVSLFNGANNKLAFLAKLSKSLRLLRLLKLVRLFKAFDFTNADNYLLKIMNKHFKGTVTALLLPNMILMIFTIHLFSCVWYFFATLDESNLNWVVMNNFSNRGLFDLYIISFYFVIQTFTSCGYGDIQSYKNIEIVFRIVVMFAGVFLYGIFSGRIVDYRSLKMAQEEIIVNKEQALERIHKKYGLRSVLYHNLLEKFRTDKTEQKRPYDFSNLLPEDRDKFDHCKFRSKFSGHALFPGGEEFKRFVLDLGHLLVKKNFNEGEIIYNQGEPPVYFYILVSGRVSFLMNLIDLVKILEVRKGYFGEYELIAQKNRQHTVVASSNCTVYQMEPLDFKKFFLTDTQDTKLRDDFIEMANFRHETLMKVQEEFNFLVRRKVFWKLLLRGRKKKKGEMNKLIKSTKNEVKRIRQKRKTLHLNNQASRIGTQGPSNQLNQVVPKGSVEKAYQRIE